MKNYSIINVLILDDEIDFTEELKDYFENAGFISYSANTVRDGYEILSQNEIDLLILDIRLPGANGLDVLKKVKSLYPNMEVIMVSAHGDMDTVIVAIRLGAFDYMRKPLRFIDLQIAIERTQKYLSMQQKLAHMEEKHSLITKNIQASIGRHVIGNSPQIMKSFELAKTASQYPDVNVLITGESGTGKEIIARIIHYMGPKSENYFGAINCSAITETLMESEFFGHKKGAFTGAVCDKKGLFELCNEGTLFLDEIADMPIIFQSKILRAIEEKVITRVGDTKLKNTTFRVISATNIDLDRLVEEKKFRLDLLHRLNTLHIHIPPLRERTEDIVPLLIDFTEEFSKKINKPIKNISDDVFKKLVCYSFPGNVRELRNMTERAIILCSGNSLKADDFSLPEHNNKLPINDVSGVKLVQHEIEHIRKALDDAKYNQSLAANFLGISRHVLIRKIKKYGINIVKREAE
ncbi:MAG: sigma-54 dependent transcriptional regulator [Chlorobium sp.]|nr:MAG: sigma-54-dependent Fis family transcriptional regulator [Chlorobium sp.]